MIWYSGSYDMTDILMLSPSAIRACVMPRKEMATRSYYVDLKQIGGYNKEDQ